MIQFVINLSIAQVRTLTKKYAWQCFMYNLTNSSHDYKATFYTGKWIPEKHFERFCIPLNYNFQWQNQLSYSSLSPTSCEDLWPEYYSMNMGRKKVKIYHVTMLHGYKKDLPTAILNPDLVFCTWLSINFTLPSC